MYKEFDEDGFKFFTNYESKKSQDLTENPKASLVFYWEPLERSIRIQGIVEKVSEEESKKYFECRPRGSQIGAWASKQSQVVKDRDELNQKFEVFLI